jgi:hypothetical protein
MSAPELSDLRDRSGAFENIPAIWRADANMMGAEKPERIELLGTSTNYFGMLEYTRRSGVCGTHSSIPAARS